CNGSFFGHGSCHRSGTGSRRHRPTSAICAICERSPSQACRLLWTIANSRFGSCVYVLPTYPKKQSPPGVLSGLRFGKSRCMTMEDGATRSRIQDLLPGQQCDGAHK
ncbi:hypothetical protein EJB05_44760, partial [Eragrostis curvula]